ncbi:hypothetical protein EON66_04605 [archaeon]|nr:MAG: hypothetical protein EON66_04605 [archaeon]
MARPAHLPPLHPPCRRLLPHLSNVTLYEAGERCGGWLHSYVAHGKQRPYLFEASARGIRYVAHIAAMQAHEQ